MSYQHRESSWATPSPAEPSPSSTCTQVGAIIRCYLFWDFEEHRRSSSSSPVVVHCTLNMGFPRFPARISDNMWTNVATDVLQKPLRGASVLNGGIFKPDYCKNDIYLTDFVFWEGNLVFWVYFYLNILRFILVN